jgi:ABC-type multidrug transport system fused ATPase/permease subunit
MRMVFCGLSLPLPLVLIIERCHTILTDTPHAMGRSEVYSMTFAPNCMHHIQTLSLRYYDTNPVGRLVTRVTNDVEALNELFSSGLVLMISDISDARRYRGVYVPH